jgi:hypothetical protein
MIERRAAWVAICVAIVLAFDASGGLGITFGGFGRWELVAYVFDLLCLAASGVLLTASVVPDSVRRLSLGNRERLLFFALVAFALAIVVIAGLSIHGAIHAYNHPSG